LYTLFNATVSFYYVFFQTTAIKAVIIKKRHDRLAACKRGQWVCFRTAAKRVNIPKEGESLFNTGKSTDTTLE
ncbi:MAG TPA: hypothetical protein PKW59_11275, partial [Thermotogota bacterium]|nr:hypothetical protein [Thermotogota bacterium]